MTRVIARPMASPNKADDKIALRSLAPSTTAIAIAAVMGMLPPLARGDTWRGTAPFCDGQCLPGETQIGSSNCGDGACCWTGHKVLCKNSSPTCQSLETQTSCAGVVLICDNGFFSVPDNVWHSCSGKHACGVCFGISSTQLPLLDEHQQ